jgi:hypothetical protein
LEALLFQVAARFFLLSEPLLPLLVERLPLIVKFLQASTQQFSLLIPAEPRLFLLAMPLPALLLERLPLLFAVVPRFFLLRAPTLLLLIEGLTLGLQIGQKSIKLPALLINVPLRLLLFSL